MACCIRPLQAQCQCCLWRWGVCRVCPQVAFSFHTAWCLRVQQDLTRCFLWAGSARCTSDQACHCLFPAHFEWSCSAVNVLLLTSQTAKGEHPTDFVGKTRIMFTLACRIKLSISRSNTACVEWHQSIGTGHSCNQFHVQHKGRLLLRHGSPAVVYRCTKIPAQRKLTGCVMLTERVLVYSPSQ